MYNISVRTREQKGVPKMRSEVQNEAISKFDVMRGGKVKETFDTYEQAWAYASKYKGAVVRYNISKINK
jgi:hypothetical protein